MYLTTPDKPRHQEANMSEPPLHVKCAPFPLFPTDYVHDCLLSIDILQLSDTRLVVRKLVQDSGHAE